MKLKTGLIITKTDGKYIAVAADEAGRAFHGMLKMNGTAVFIAELLREETDEAALTDAVCEKYHVDQKLAAESVKTTVVNLRKANLLNE